MSENTFKVGDLVYYIEDQELKWGRIIKIATLFEDTYYKIHEQGQYYYFTTKDVIFPITIPTWDLLSYMQERDIMLASYAHYCNIKEQKEFMPLTPRFRFV